MPNSKRKCCYCKTYKRVGSMIKLPVGYFCDPHHAFLYGSENSIRDAEKATKKKRAAFKKKVRDSDRPYQIKKAQEQFNKFIRLRDKGQPCISCQKPMKAVYAGHYKSVGAHGELRFNEDNCHAQCFKCNSYLSGNTGEYRKHLIDKIGLDRVEELEGPHPVGELSLSNVIQIKEHYRSECRKLTVEEIGEK